MPTDGFVTRFAPSPTGPLHLGHAYSAMLAHDMAMAKSGTFLLRIEDIDQSRARPNWVSQIFDDLQWLGLRWPAPVMRQSDRLSAYADALSRLCSSGHGLLYACTCTRRDIKDAIGAPQEGVPTHGPDGQIYPGTCRRKHRNSIADSSNENLRLNMDNATVSLALDSETSPRLGYDEFYTQSTSQRIEFKSETLISTVGDIVLCRADMRTSYHLSVVLDDAAQGITDVIRGEDLSEATKIHVLLQKLLDLPTPRYHHHSLIRDDAGKRLAKRDDARALSKFRTEGATPEDIRRMVGLPII